MVMSGILPGSRVSVGIPAVAGFRDLVGFTSGAWYYQFDTRSYQWMQCYAASWPAVNRSSYDSYCA